MIGNQSLVQFEDVIFPMDDEILYDDILHPSLRESISGKTEQIIALVEIQFHGNTKGEECLLRRNIIPVTHLGEKPAVDIRPLIDLAVLHPLGIDELEKVLAERKLRRNIKTY